MSIYNQSTVEIESSDEQLHWKVFAPGGVEPICVVSYAYLFDLTSIYKNADHLNALGACLCYAGLPSAKILDTVRNKYQYSKIHPFCFKMMVDSNWATKASRDYAHKIPREQFAEWDSIDYKQIQYIEKLGGSGYKASSWDPGLPYFSQGQQTDLKHTPAKVRGKKKIKGDSEPLNPQAKVLENLGSKKNVSADDMDGTFEEFKAAKIQSNKKTKVEDRNEDDEEMEIEYDIPKTKVGGGKRKLNL